MNTNYLAIVLWIGSLIVQFIAYMILAARQRGRDDIKIAEVAELRTRLLSVELQLSNIRGWIKGSFGVTNGG